VFSAVFVCTELNALNHAAQPLVGPFRHRQEFLCAGFEDRRWIERRAVSRPFQQFVDVEFFDLTPYCLSALYFRSDMWLVHEFRGDLVGRLVTRFSCGCRSVFAGPL
jgi:hypothetical protein